MKQPSLFEGLSELGLSVPDEQINLLERFETILGNRGVRLGLVAESDSERIRTRHLLDCARAAGVPAPRTTALDLGSGAGLPGMVVAILRPDVEVVMVERRERRAAFLEWALESLRLANGSVLAGDLAVAPEGQAATCFARALASLEESWEMAHPLLTEGGKLVYFAGADAQIPTSLKGARGLEVVRPTAGAVAQSGPLVIISA